MASSAVVLQLFDPEDHPSPGNVEGIAGSVRSVALYRWPRPDDEALALLKELSFPFRT